MSPADDATTKRALVTAGTGFLASHLVQLLCVEGWEVHVVARTVAHAPKQAGVITHTWRGTTHDMIHAVRASRPHVVFHIAGLILAQHTPDQVATLVEANVLLGTQLLEAMASEGVSRFVNAGTSTQYFHSDTYRPASLYAATKQAFEDILAYYVDAAGVRAITLALFNSYGPGERGGKLLSLLLHCLRTGETLSLSPGEQLLDLVHATDVARALLRAAELLEEPAQPASSLYTVSGGERVSLRELVAMLEQAAGRKLSIAWGGRPYREREVMRPWAGKPLPGWTARVHLAEGLRELLSEEPA